jgi:hypothetical protein
MKGDIQKYALLAILPIIYSSILFKTPPKKIMDGSQAINLSL